MGLLLLLCVLLCSLGVVDAKATQVHIAYGDEPHQMIVQWNSKDEDENTVKWGTSASSHSK